MVLLYCLGLVVTYEFHSVDLFVESCGLVGSMKLFCMFLLLLFFL